MLFTASDTSRILAYSAFCFLQVYASIFNHIQRFWGILTHIETLLRHIQAYSAPCGTLAYSQPCHILNPSIFSIGGLFKPYETLTRHIHSTAIGHYSTIFRHIQNLAQNLHTQKTCMIGILEYSELFPNCIPTYI